MTTVHVRNRITPRAAARNIFCNTNFPNEHEHEHKQVPSPPPRASSVSFCMQWPTQTTMAAPPPPNPRELLPPLLACLPTSFISPQAPPALLPLLAPILRQRVSYLSSGGSSGKDGWLPLLSWDPQNALKLPAAVERMILEPHPVSGEIELDDVPPAKYRRLDEETLQSRLEAEQFDLVSTFVWVDSDEHGGTGPGWKLADLKSLEDVEDGTTWYDTLLEANRAAMQPESVRTNGNGVHHAYSTPPLQSQRYQEEDDGDEYWASYDRTLENTTPAPAPAPIQTSTSVANRQRTTSELEYFDRYGVEVQPALDSHDPDEHYPEIVGNSTLTGGALVHAQASSAQSGNLAPPLHPAHGGQLGQEPISMPRPRSPTSSQGSVDRLEERAAAMSSEQPQNDQAQRGIQQHISTDIKSLFRLARSAGMERSEFERIVRTELECLGMMDRDE